MNMKLKAIGPLLLFVACFAPVSLLAQQGAATTTAKPYHEGPIWDISTIHVKYGMEERYLNYLATDWKKQQEALKKAGYVLDYRVITTEAHAPQDFNVILMTQFKDLASLEANQDKMEAVTLQLIGGQQRAETGATQRGDYREVVGDRLGREIILEPKPAGK